MLESPATVYYSDFIPGMDRGPKCLTHPIYYKTQPTKRILTHLCNFLDKLQKHTQASISYRSNSVMLNTQLFLNRIQAVQYLELGLHCLSYWSMEQMNPTDFQLWFFRFLRRQSRPVRFFSNVVHNVGLCCWYARRQNYAAVISRNNPVLELHW